MISSRGALRCAPHVERSSVRQCQHSAPQQHARACDDATKKEKMMARHGASALRVCAAARHAALLITRAPSASASAMAQHARCAAAAPRAQQRGAKGEVAARCRAWLYAMRRVRRVDALMPTCLRHAARFMTAKSCAMPRYAARTFSPRHAFDIRSARRANATASALF